MEMENKGAKRALIGLVAVAAVVIAGAWILTPGSQTGKQPAQVSNVLPADNTGSVAADAPTLVVPDQFPGAVVFVAQVKLAKGGWVVIYDDAAGQPGKIIGAGYFDANASLGDINLSTVTVEGRSYYAALYSDNGDVSFNPAVDLPITDASGKALMVRFLATSNLPASKG